MAVPEYQSLMLPILWLAGDGQDHTISEAIESIAKDFELTDADRSELLPSGQQFRFDNRVHWARTYLKQADLIESTGRGKFRITERGLQVLRTNPSHIDNEYLTRFPEFRDFKTRSRRNSEEVIQEAELERIETPEEALQSVYQRLRAELAHDLLEKVMSCSPRFFERLVIDLLVAMGYGGSRRDAGERIGQTGDGGIDGVIKEDRLGLDVVYIQAKRWQGVVGRPVVQAFAGSLEGIRARKGVLITTSSFSKDATEYVDRIEKKIVLIDGQQLAQYMMDFGIGVNEVEKYVIKRIDLDYFGEEA